MQRFKDRAMRRKAGPETASEAAAERGTPSAKPTVNRPKTRKSSARKSTAKKNTARKRR
jgi:hypothetical protein